MRKLFFLIVFLSISISVVAQTQDSTANTQPQRKKVGLVLSGVGARGVAHVGVIKVLEEAGIPIDYIAGTSMGSLVGALYAIGYTPEQMSHILTSQNWMELLIGTVPRNELLFVEKENKDKTIVSLPYDGKNIKIATGFLNGNSVQNLFSILTTGYHNMTSFDDLPIPYACIAYDITTGDEVVFRGGNLAVAMRSSMSIPGAFDAVNYDNKILIDGGVINNFPVDVIKKMGADIVIGVDVSTITEQREKLQDPSSNEDRRYLSFAVRNLMGRLGKEKFLQNKNSTDLYIHPDLGNYTVASFTNTAIDSMLVYGERSARLCWDDLNALKKEIGVISEADLPEAKHKTAPAFYGKIPIAEIYFHGTGNLKLKNLYRILTFKQDSEITFEDLRKSLFALYGTGYFSSSLYRIIKNGDKYDLHIDCTLLPLSTFNFGLRFDSYDFGAFYANAQIVPSFSTGSMLEITSRISFDPYISAGIYYLNPWVGRFGVSYQYRHGIVRLFNDDVVVPENRFHWSRFKADLGNFHFHNFNFSINARYEIFTPETDLLMLNTYTNEKEKYMIYNANVEYDNFTDAYFPEKGAHFTANYQYITDDWVHYKGHNGYQTLFSSFSVVVPMGHRFALIPQIFGHGSIGTDVPFPYQNMLGGPISGIYMDQQMAFYGIGPQKIMDNHYAAVALKARVRIGENHYIWAVANAAHTSADVKDLLNLNAGSTYYGGAIGYSYKTPFGPLEILFDYGNLKKRNMGFYINIGKYF